MNKVVIIGRLTADPVHAVRNVAGVTMNVCNFTVAVNSRNSAGNERTDFFKVGVWQGAADACAAYLKKGSLVGVSGSVGVDQRTYNGKVYTNMVVHNARVEFLNKLPSTTAASVDTDVSTTDEEEPIISNEAENIAEETDDDDLPF